ncbi:MAG: ATP-binding protein [Proteobacteria bacterium]|nr:ATP-binding protein [Pseudomonadota bacterium]
MSVKDELSILYKLIDIFKELSFSPERKDISDVVIKGLISVFNLDSAFFYVLDEKRENFLLELSTNQEKRCYSVGEGLIGKVGKEGNIYIERETTTDNSFCIAVPVIGKKNILGVIGGRRNKAKAFNSKEKDLIKVFGYQVGIAMESYIYHKRLIRSKEFRDSILYNILSGILVINKKREIKTFNKSACSLLEDDNLKGKQIHNFFNQEVILNKIEEVIKYNQPRKNIEIEREGYFFNVSLIPLPTEQSEIDVMIIIDDITEIKKALEEKETAKRMTLIGQLSAGIAHEIRNPITGINITLDMLKEAPNITENQTKSINKILKELSDIEDLINSLLEITKPTTLKLKNENIDDFIKAFITRIGDLAKKKNITIKYDCDSENARAMIDEKRLNQVFMNLFNNSLEAINENGIIEIKLSELKENIIISFKDYGSGIKKDIIDKIYEPFYTTKREGAGLGLYITKSIIEGHNGTIKVTSDGNTYTEFLITLPKIRG